ncbi:hypothetical protein OPQ81_002544 [Rhizoctonia solani]|nr:hypothetical protein OPQ81_002544 [Rhizoctonia solani]
MPWLKIANPAINWNTLEVVLSEMEEARLTSEIPSIPEGVKIPLEFQKFHRVFGDEFFTTLPENRPYDCAIDLEEGKEVPYGPIYSMTPLETNALKEYLDSELAAGKIHPSTSPSGAPVMFLKRLDGRLHLVVDYKKLNKITIKNCYALPRQEELIDELKHAKIFTKLDLRNGHNNIRIKEGHEWKTAFRTKYGHYEYTVMPFGLTNAAAVFQRFMNDIFRDLLDISIVVYMDDILIFSESKEHHVKHVEQVLAHLQDNHLFCNPDKCHFFVQKVTYIGLVIAPEGISMEMDKVQSIMEWPTPRMPRT